MGFVGLVSRPDYSPNGPGRNGVARRGPEIRRFLPSPGRRWPALCRGGTPALARLPSRLFRFFAP